MYHGGRAAGFRNLPQQLPAGPPHCQPYPPANFRCGIVTLGDAPWRSCQWGQQLPHDEVMFTPLHLLFQNRFTFLLGTMFSLGIWLCLAINPVSWSFLIKEEKLCSLIIKQADTSWIFQKSIINYNTKSVTSFHREIYRQKVSRRKQVAVTTHKYLISKKKKKNFILTIAYLLHLAEWAAFEKKVDFFHPGMEIIKWILQALLKWLQWDNWHKYRLLNCSVKYLPGFLFQHVCIW